MYILSNWIVLQTLAPGNQVEMRLYGEVFGHPDYLEGEEVTVSPLCSCRQDGDTVTVITHSGSEYILGRPNRAEPDALTRVMRHLQLWGAAEANADADRKSAIGGIRWTAGGSA